MEGEIITNTILLTVEVLASLKQYSQSRSSLNLIPLALSSCLNRLLHSPEKKKTEAFDRRERTWLLSCISDLASLFSPRILLLAPNESAKESLL